MHFLKTEIISVVIITNSCKISQNSNKQFGTRADEVATDKQNDGMVWRSAWWIQNWVEQVCPKAKPKNATCPGTG